jgi:hypothetical protein
MRRTPEAVLTRSRLRTGSPQISCIGAPALGESLACLPACILF